MKTKKGYQVCMNDGTFCETTTRIHFTKYGLWYKGEGGYRHFIPHHRLYSIMHWRK